MGLCATVSALATVVRMAFAAAACTAAIADAEGLELTTIAMVSLPGVVPVVAAVRLPQADLGR